MFILYLFTNCELSIFYLRKKYYNKNWMFILHFIAYKVYILSQVVQVKFQFIYIKVKSGIEKKHNIVQIIILLGNDIFLYLCCCKLLCKKTGWKCNIPKQKQFYTCLILYKISPLGNILTYTFGTMISCFRASFSLRKKVSGIHTFVGSVNVRYFNLPRKKKEFKYELNSK